MNTDHFFYRKVIFTRKDNQIALANIYQPEKSTPLEQWLGTVLSLADGTHTIAQMLDLLRSRYATPPENLEKTVESVIDRLVESKMIELSNFPVALPYYLAAPIEELDIEQARKLIQKDGYGLH